MASKAVHRSLLALVGACLSISCSGDTNALTWRLRFAPDVEPLIRYIEVRITRGPCAGSSSNVAYSAGGRIGVFAPAPPPSLGEGTYCFAASARNAECLGIAGGSLERELRRDEPASPIDLELRLLPPNEISAACTECVDGECARNDAGMDSGPTIDAGMDAGTDADTGPGSDSGTDSGTDTGTESDSGTDSGPRADVGIDPPIDAGPPFDAGTSPPCSDGITWSGLDVGYRHTCALTTGRALYCWGSHVDGQLGLGGAVGASVLRPRMVGTSYLGISLGQRHTCGVHMGSGFTERAQGLCSGSQEMGLLGNGTSAGSANAPQPVTPLLVWRSIAAADRHSCGITSGGALYCWGAGGPQLGLGPSSDITMVTRVGTAVDWVGAFLGSSMSCATAGIEGRLYCWGSNSTGALASIPDGTSTPTQLGTEVGWLRASLGTTHACFLRNDDVIYCAGRNERGQLGHVGPDSSTLTAVSGGHHWSRVTAGHEVSCGIRLDGGLMCWGTNTVGQLGFGSAAPISSSAPLSVVHPTSRAFVEVATNERASHVCAIDDEGHLFCWGGNDSGQLGVGDTFLRYAPTRVCL